VVFEPPGLGQLGQLGRQRRSGARQLRWLASAIEGGDVVGIALDHVGDPAVGHGLVDDLAEDLEHVRDLVENAGKLRVADHGFAAARRAPGAGHGSPF
jgi:hypothetical protein